MYKYIFLSVVLMMGIANSGKSQSQSQYIPPSPNAQTFLKYGDYPVNYSTGLPSINIPLYTISLKDYSFPISASFHASGRMASLNFSPLGMNWALLASGVISREIRGIPDERANHRERTASSYSPQGDHLQEISELAGQQIVDPEYDIFSLNINDISSKFIIKDGGQVVFLTYCPYKLSVGGNGTIYTNFSLTDDKGVIYYFGAANNLGFTELNANSGSTSWFINSITTPSGNKIEFKYAAKSTMYDNDSFYGNFAYSDVATIADLPSAYPFLNEEGGDMANLHLTNQNSISDFTMGYLTEIDFDNGKVLFSYNASNLLLDGCKVIDNFSGENKKDISFVYFDIPGTGTSTLLNNNTKTIQNIFFKNTDGIVTERYGFNYYAGTTPTMTTFGKQRDYWGYWNNRTTNGQGSNYIPVPTISVTASTTVPGQTYNKDFGCIGCREPNFSAKVVGMIKNIYYPTGGSSEFIYESNHYKDPFSVPNDKEGPGIRIQQIISRDAMGNSITKVYKYGENEDGMGTLTWIPSSNDYVTAVRKNLLAASKTYSSANYPSDYGFYRFRTYNSEPVPEVQRAMRIPVYYSKVTEYSSAKTPGENGKTEYYYTAFSSSQPYLNVDSDVPFYIQNYNEDIWSTPQLQSKVIYKYNESTNNYSILSSEVYNFQKYNAVNISQANVYQYQQLASVDYYNGLQDAYEHINPIYYLLDKTITSAVMKPVSVLKTEFDGAGNSIVSTTLYDYKNLTHLNPTKISVSKSDKKNLVTYINYPQDYPAGTPFIDALKSNNIIVPIEKVITQQSGSDVRILSGEIYTYKEIGKGLADQIFKTETSGLINLSAFKFSNRTIGILPETGNATSFSKDNVYALKTTFDSYDAKSNPLTITQTNNNPVSYIWGYNQTYPVAEINNALSKNVFYTSFEETGGNSSAGDSKTGKFSHTTSYSNTLTNLDNGDYILSYWKKIGATWAFNTSTVSVTTNSYTINLTGQIDEVKFYPKGAMMKTYTYEPLVGMTSSTDVNDRSTYYTYDKYKRLQVIQDDERNIVKEYDYNLINPLFFNTVKSGTFTKTGCGADYLGSSVTYTVADGTYSSNISQADADSKAVADVNAKGQAYANANGYCWNYKNQEDHKVFIKACPEGLYGSEIDYVVPAGKFTSVISLQDAQAKATNDINTNGQNYANTLPSGKCYTYEEAFKNAEISVNLKKDNCPIGYTGSAYPYNPFVIPYGKYISTVSQDAADDKAEAELIAKQIEVNNSGSCTAISSKTIQVSNSTHYDVLIVFSNAQGSQSYTAVQGDFYGTVTVPDITYNLISMDPTPSNSNSFHFTLGSTTQQGTHAYFYNVQAANITITN